MELVKYMVVRIVVLVGIVCAAILAVSQSDAKEAYSTGALGVFNSGKSSLAESKFFNLGVRDDLGLFFKEQYEVGFWSDSAGLGRRSSGYGAYQLGLEVGDSLVSRVMAGPAVITSPDTYLGGPFPQFTEDFYIGMQDKKEKAIGIKYKHFSSGGIYQPNVGRDYMGIEVKIPFTF